MKVLYILILVTSTTLLNAQNNVFDVCRNGTLEDIKTLHKENPNSINKKNDAGYTPLILACYYGNEDVVAFLIERVDNINGTSSYGTPLMAAVVKRNINISKMLLNKKANPNIADTNGTTALHYATLFKETEIVKLLLKAGANSNLKDGNNKSAYDYAIINGNHELLNLFKK